MSIVVKTAVSVVNVIGRVMRLGTLVKVLVVTLMFDSVLVTVSVEKYDVSVTIRSMLRVTTNVRVVPDSTIVCVSVTGGGCSNVKMGRVRTLVTTSCSVTVVWSTISVDKVSVTTVVNVVIAGPHEAVLVRVRMVVKVPRHAKQQDWHFAGIAFAVVVLTVVLAVVTAFPGQTQFFAHQVHSAEQALLVLSFRKLWG